jgi:hypothetical protein
MKTLGKVLQLQSKLVIAVALLLGATGCAQFNYSGLFSKQATPGDVIFGLLNSSQSSQNLQTSPNSSKKDQSATGWTAITSVTPTDLGGGFIALGDTTPLVVTLKNPGMLPVSGFQFTIDPPSMTQNYQVQSTCTTLDATGVGSAKTSGTNDTCSVTVTFNPQILQTVSANLIVSYNTNKGAAQSTLPLSGNSLGIPYYWFVSDSGSTATDSTCAVVDIGQVILEDGKLHAGKATLKFNGALPGATLNGKSLMTGVATMTRDSSGDIPSDVLTGNALF